MVLYQGDRVEAAEMECICVFLSAIQFNKSLLSLRRISLVVSEIITK